MSSDPIRKPEPTRPRKIATQEDLEKLSDKLEKELSDKIEKELQRLKEGREENIKASTSATSNAKKKRKKSVDPNDIHGEAVLQIVIARHWEPIFDYVIKRGGFIDAPGLQSQVERFIQPREHDYDEMPNGTSRLRRTVLAAISTWPGTDPKGPPFIREKRNRYCINPKWES